MPPSSDESAQPQGASPPAPVARRRPREARAALPGLLRLLNGTEGFTLVPVEVPGPDLARALARWLGEHGRHVRVVQPASPEEWRGLPATLLRQETAPYGATMLLGAPPPRDDVAAGLRLLNQRRDRVARGLDAPLLWAGTSDFLRETASEAPDFWSVRGLVWRIAPRAARPSAAAPAWSGPLVPEEPEHLASLVAEALRQDDPLNAARIGYLLAASLASRSRIPEARAALDRAIDVAGDRDADLSFDLRVLDARLAILAGAAGRARRRLAEARRLAGDSPGKGAQVDLIVARQWALAGRREAAEALLQRVIAACQQDRPFLAARAMTSLARLYRWKAHREPKKLGEAEALLREALALFVAQGEGLGEANALMELGDLARQAGRSSEAQALYQGARETFRTHGARDGLARANRRLAAASNVGEAG